MTAIVETAERAGREAAFDPRRIRVGAIGAARLLRGLDTGRAADGTDVGAHRYHHGHRPQPTRAELLGRLDAAGLTGRGGAGFPLADKIRALRPGDPVVVVNGAEGEPGSAKDAVLLTRTPHLVLDGAAVVAQAIGATRTTVVVTDPAVEQVVRRAVARRPDAARFEVRRLPARFIAGEARTVVRVLSGGPQLPPGRRVHATDRGVGGAPTLLANVETFAQVAVLGGAVLGGAVLGGAVLGGAGPVRPTHAEVGTTLLTVTGAVARPGVFEVPIGIPLGAVAAHVGARPSRSVVVGGYHGAWLQADPALPLSRGGLSAAGGTLGAGVVMFLGDDSCPSAELSRIADWLAGQSARQCGPCAFGLPTLADEIRAVRVTDRAAVAAVRHLRQLPGRGACTHPDGSARFLASGLAVCTDDLDAHQRHNRCGRPDRGYLSTDRRTMFQPAMFDDAMFDDAKFDDAKFDDGEQW